MLCLGTNSPQRFLELGGMLADVSAERFHVVHRSFGKNAVAEIKDVARASGGLAQNIFGSRFEFFPIGEEQHRIEIALDGAFETEAPPSGVERNTPVEADYLRASLLHRRQKRGAVSAEIDDWHASFLQAFYEVRRMRQNVTPIIFDAQAAYPAIENLDGVSAGAH